MYHRGHSGLWIGVALLFSAVNTSCCRKKGTVCLYDRPCGGGAVGVSWMPEGDWGYGLLVQTKGPHAATNKAFAVCTEDGSDGFVIYGDGRVVASNLCEFNAPLKVKEIYTDSGAKWPDYVFESSYRLRSLYDLEAFIRQNKHLPGLPSQAMVARDGVPLVSTQKALIEKVEELTLYVIALQKQVDSLKALLQADSRTHSR